MKFFVALFVVTVALGAVSAGYIGGGGWSPGYARVVYAPAYTVPTYYSGYGGWNRGWSAGWNNGWSSGLW